MLQRTKHQLPPKRLRNRRVFERYDIDHKQLALMNAQDILLVRDLSQQGFHTEVSERGYKKLVVGDVFLSRIRYLKEIHEAEVCVRWKSNRFVGFELLKAGKDTRKFVKRLIQPIEVGSSLKIVEVGLGETQNNAGVQWYQGANETNFFLWLNDCDEPRAWKLEDPKNYVSWDQDKGISTGVVLGRSMNAMISFSPWAEKIEPDVSPSVVLMQYAADVFMALQSPVKDALVDSVLEQNHLQFGRQNYGL